MSNLEAPYGYCPQCGAPCAERERRPNGNDRCVNGHSYPSASAMSAAPVEAGRKVVVTDESGSRWVGYVLGFRDGLYEITESWPPGNSQMVNPSLVQASGSESCAQ